MSTIVRSELRKLRYTRSLLGLAAAGVLISVAAATVLMTWIDASEIANRLSAHGPLRFGATNLGLILVVFGARVFADETQHRTLSPTFLSTPDRTKVLAAKSLVAAVVALVVCVTVWAAVLPVTAFAVSARDLVMTVDTADTAALFVRATTAMVLLTLLAVGLAAAIRNRTVVLVASIVWIALAEDIVGAVLRIGEYLPSATVSSLVRGGGSADGLGAAASAGVLACWTAAAYLAAVISLRRDVS